MPDDDVPLLRPSAAGELGLHLKRLRPLRRLRPALHRPRPGASPLPPGRRLRPPTLAATPPRRLTSAAGRPLCSMWPEALAAVFPSGGHTVLGKEGREDVGLCEELGESCDLGIALRRDGRLVITLVESGRRQSVVPRQGHGGRLG